MNLEALLSWSEELWSRRPVATSAGGDGTKPPKEKKKDVLLRDQDCEIRVAFTAGKSPHTDEVVSGAKNWFNM